MGPLGRKGETVTRVGIRRGIEPCEDAMLVDHDAGDERSDQPSGHQMSPATLVATVLSSMMRGVDLQTLARIRLRARRVGVAAESDGAVRLSALRLAR